MVERRIEAAGAAGDPKGSQGQILFPCDHASRAQRERVLTAVLSGGQQNSTLAPSSLRGGTHACVRRSCVREAENQSPANLMLYIREGHHGARACRGAKECKLCRCFIAISMWGQGSGAHTGCVMCDWVSYVRFVSDSYRFAGPVRSRAARWGTTLGLGNETITKQITV